MEGKHIGDYEIISSLGKGGFGSVWKAKSSTGATVAMKVLNPQALENDKVVKKFFHEAMILAKLDHPNITKLLEFFPDGNNYSIVMDYVEGVELKKLLQQQKNLLPFNFAFKIAKQTLDAFQYAHENGILHRDIKPGNIMIDNKGNAKIMDFGIAKMSSTASHDTAASMLSIHYTAPERFDKSKVVDARSDIYSLGLVFYEMFAGRRPYASNDTSQVMFFHLNEVPDPPMKYAPSLPKHISQAISKSLEKDPANRFKDFRQFSNAFGPGSETISAEADAEATMILDGEVTLIEPSGPQQLAAAPAPPEDAKKKKTKLIAIAAAVVVLLTAGYFGLSKFVFNKSGGSGINSSVKIENAQINAKGFQEVKHPKDASLMVFIPEGKFKMGSDTYDAEKPVQEVSLGNYFIDKNLVTNAQFKKFMEETKYVTDAEKERAGMVRIGQRWKKVEGASWKMPDGMTSIEGKDDYPVSQISYNDALNYCKWANKDLPTEAQWEKGARGPDGNEYPWGNTEPNNTTANFDNLIGSTSKSGSFEKGQSLYGLLDMAGNVYQWCKDGYGTGPRAESNPAGPESGTERVIKGGSFIESMESLRSANRDRYEPGYSSFLFGFRCACEEIK